MLGISLASPLLTFDSATRLCFSTNDLTTAPPNIGMLNMNVSTCHSPKILEGAESSHHSFRKWAIFSTALTANISLSGEDRATWEECRESLSAFNFSVEEEDKILGKAFGHIHSPYWSEERKVEVPNYETVNETLDYLRSLSLSDDDLLKLLKKFPEVLGCSLEHELKTNVKTLEKEWGIEGKSLRKLLLRNPKVLGYNVDCKGDCMAKCTRCWVRF